MRHFKGNLLLTVLTVVGLPMLLTLLTESLYLFILEPEPARQSSLVLWLIRLCGLGLTVQCAMSGLKAWKKGLDQQIDALIEQCHAISLSEPISYRPQQLNLPDLARLELAIMVMRDVLLDYLVIYRRFFEAAPDMFLSLTPAGRRIQDANQSFFTKLGLLKSEVLGQPVEKFVALDLGWDHAMMDQGKLQKGFLISERSRIKVEVNLSWERRTQGQPWLLGARISDVTEREHLMNEVMSKSAALEKALEEARSVEKLKDEFLTTLSHEIKTPLVSLKGFLQLIKEGRAQPEKQSEYLEICWRNLVKLEGQINNLLDLARLSAKGQQGYAMERLDLGALLRTEVENLRAMAAKRRVTIAEPPSGEFMIRGNAEKMMQLIDNLLINAVKYNKEHGEVITGLSIEGNKVVLEVSDSGVGIEREQMAKIFNRFYRAKMTGTGRIEGLGIGLSLVQEIVLLHGGDIKVASVPGEGTSFTVELEAA